ncbi:Hypothetical protein, putative, partial [Bodo saltans]
AGVLDQILAFTPLQKPTTSPQQQQRTSLMAQVTHDDDSLNAVRKRSWALVAASVMAWTAYFCRRDPFENERRHLLDSLDTYLLTAGRTPKTLTTGHRTPRKLSLGGSSVPVDHSTQQSPWTCKALAQQSGDKWARGQLPGGRICPCSQKRVVIVRNVIIVGVFYAGVLDQILAFTPLQKPTTSPQQQQRTSLMAQVTHDDDSLNAVRKRSWALVAASVMAWTAYFCRRDPFENERRHLLDSLDTYLLTAGRTPKTLTTGHRTPRKLSLGGSSVPVDHSTQQSPWTCKALAQQSGDKRQVGASCGLRERHRTALGCCVLRPRGVRRHRRARDGGTVQRYWAVHHRRA